MEYLEDIHEIYKRGFMIPVDTKILCYKRVFDGLSCTHSIEEFRRFFIEYDKDTDEIETCFDGGDSWSGVGYDREWKYAKLLKALSIDELRDIAKKENRKIKTPEVL